MRLPGPRLMRVFAMELFTKLFGDLLLFIYHCFDRIVIHGYLSGLSRPEQVVHFFRKVVGIPVLSKEILSQRTADYQNWVEAFARNHNIPIEWAEKGVLCQEDARASCCVRDEGKALRSRPVGGGFKPPRAASAKTRGGERLG